MDTDAILYIFTFLDIKSVIYCSLVCKSFNNISKNELIWKRLFTETYPCIIKHLQFYVNYKNIYEFDKFLIKYVSINIDQEINVRSLSLHYNQFQSIPTEIGQYSTNAFQINRVRAMVPCYDISINCNIPIDYIVIAWNNGSDSIDCFEKVYQYPK